MGILRRRRRPGIRCPGDLEHAVRGSAWPRHRPCGDHVVPPARVPHNDALPRCNGGGADQTLSAVHNLWVAAHGARAGISRSDHRHEALQQQGRQRKPKHQVCHAVPHSGAWHCCLRANHRLCHDPDLLPRTSGVPVCAPPVALLRRERGWFVHQCRLSQRLGRSGSDATAATGGTHVRHLQGCRAGYPSARMLLPLRPLCRLRRAQPARAPRGPEPGRRPLSEVHGALLRPARSEGQHLRDQPRAGHPAGPAGGALEPRGGPPQDARGRLRARGSLALRGGGAGLLARIHGALHRGVDCRRPPLQPPPRRLRHGRRAGRARGRLHGGEPHAALRGGHPGGSDWRGAPCTLLSGPDLPGLPRRLGLRRRRAEALDAGLPGLLLQVLLQRKGHVRPPRVDRVHIAAAALHPLVGRAHTAWRPFLHRDSRDTGDGGHPANCCGKGHRVIGVMGQK
mmetsp:Transcript_101637/g.322849  ORF Transcript_101637/g.322849 Transcript_101637/m.322849 type:complete len:453 (+) Transcript_101637:293-1651(+)